MEEESSGSTGGIATLASVAFVVLSCTTMAVLAVMNHPHKAVLVLVGTMFIMAAMRAVWPGRPWFASRRRWADVGLFVVLGALIWSFSPYTATLGLG